MEVHGKPDDPADRPLITLADLQRWEDHGAGWRALEIADGWAVVELCTCHGEAVDVVRGETPELIAFLRAAPRSADG
jgi:hypothetical protein